MSQSTPSTLWVFGYGSLVWNPGFTYRTSLIGKIRGYTRRFWQGNVVHRGTPDQGVTWGKAFELADESSLSALEYLNTRESKLGGYSTHLVKFEPRDPSVAPFSVLIYIATQDNPMYLGPAPAWQIADQIAISEGNCGPNTEYLFRLADFMRNSVPEVADDHLFTLESLVQSRLKELNGGRSSPSSDSSDSSGEEEGMVAGENGEAGAPQRPNTFQYAANVPKKKLRCLKV